MGGSGGGGGVFSSRSPEEVADLVRKAEERTSAAQFESELSEILGHLLAQYNGRDVDLVRERLDAVKEILENSIEGSVDQFFGGSVAKHTYVDGLSDIDSLFTIDETGLTENTPAEILNQVTDTLQKALPDVKSVSHGRMAVTVEYQDGMTIQLLPCIKTESGMKVPSSRTEGWSHIDPKAFQEALTRRNEQCAGKLVPTIKLAKAVIGTLPEQQRLSGYHVESLAIAGFRGYDGVKTPGAMLPFFFERAKDLVLEPISDRTGQSIHVDQYLGGKGSEARVAASHILSRIAKRMRNATHGMSKAQWQALFENGE